MDGVTARYQQIIKDIESDMKQAEEYIVDLKARYDKNDSIEDIIKIQSMVLKIQDYVSQKRIQKTEIERQMLEIK